MGIDATDKETELFVCIVPAFAASLFYRPCMRVFGDSLDCYDSQRSCGIIRTSRKVLSARKEDHLYFDAERRTIGEAPVSNPDQSGRTR